jgi:hypothetical protein
MARNAENEKQTKTNPNLNSELHCQILIAVKSDADSEMISRGAAAAGIQAFAHPSYYEFRKASRSGKKKRSMVADLENEGLRMHL